MIYLCNIHKIEDNWRGREYIAGVQGSRVLGLNHMFVAVDYLCISVEVDFKKSHVEKSDVEHTTFLEEIFLIIALCEHSLY